MIEVNDKTYCSKYTESDKNTFYMIHLTNLYLQRSTLSNEEIDTEIEFWSKEWDCKKEIREAKDLMKEFPKTKKTMEGFIEEKQSHLNKLITIHRIYNASKKREMEMNKESGKEISNMEVVDLCEKEASERYPSIPFSFIFNNVRNKIRCNNRMPMAGELVACWNDEKAISIGKFKARIFNHGKYHDSTYYTLQDSLGQYEHVMKITYDDFTVDFTKGIEVLKKDSRIIWK